MSKKERAGRSKDQLSPETKALWVGDGEGGAMPMEQVKAKWHLK